MSASTAVSEARLWEWLAKARKTLRDELHITRLENSVGSGTPDVEGCLSGRQFWIELKCVARPASPHTEIRVRFQPAQPPWLSRRHEAGGRTFVLLQVGHGSKASRYLIRAHRMNTRWLSDGMPESDLRRVSTCREKARARDVIAAATVHP